MAVVSQGRFHSIFTPQMSVSQGLEVVTNCQIFSVIISYHVTTACFVHSPPGGTQRLSRLIGPVQTKEMIFTGNNVDGLKAFKLGLVNEVVNQNDKGDAAFMAALDLAKDIVPNVSFLVGDTSV